jgi:Flp pilus assembly protein TadG
MIKSPGLFPLYRVLRRFRSAQEGNLGIISAIALVPLLGAIAGAVDYSRANSVYSSMQAALDSAALSTVKIASTLTKDGVQAEAQKFFAANFNRPEAAGVQVTAQYDPSKSTLKLDAATTVQAEFMQVVGIAQLSVNASSTATIGAKRWPVCVLITDPTSKHTLLTKNAATIDFHSCMVQVNTTNWDAVEARDTSYIHSTNGDNCFVGDIHYGDVLPPKDPSCTMFPDPFAGYAMPASASTCTYTNYTASTGGAVLNPGTYCGDLTITAPTATLSPGLYIVKDGDLNISGSTVTANGVTFLLTGSGPQFSISSNSQVTITPANAAAAGPFAGFAFYLDNNSTSPCVAITDGNQFSKKAKGSTGNCVSNISNNSTVTMSGIIYLFGEALVVENYSRLTVNPGSIVADFILPNTNSTVSLIGSLNTGTSAEIAMQKTGSQSGGPVLVR